MELCVMICCMANTAFLCLLGVQLLRKEKPKEEIPQTQQPVYEETEEEKEARRLAAEAQRLYEQGFVNLMNFDGMPRKDGDRL